MTQPDDVSNQALGEAFLDYVATWGAMNPHRQFAQGEYDPEKLSADEAAAQERLEAILAARKARSSGSGASDER